MPTRSRHSRWMTVDCRRNWLLALYIAFRVTAKGGGRGGGGGGGGALSKNNI